MWSESNLDWLAALECRRRARIWFRPGLRVGAGLGAEAVSPTRIEVVGSRPPHDRLLPSTHGRMIASLMAKARIVR